MADVTEYQDKILRLMTRLESLSKGTGAKLATELVKRMNAITASISVGAWQTKADVAELRKEINAILLITDTAQQAIIDEAFFASVNAGYAAETAGMASIWVDTTAVRQVETLRIANAAWSHILEDSAVTVEQFWDKYITTSDNRYKQIPMLAYSEGWSMTKAIDAVRRFTQTDKRSAVTVTRTSIMSAANTARDDVSRQLKINKQIFLATLDSRTTDICMYNDGKVFNLKEGPHPPLHPSCRSTRVSVPNDMTPTDYKADLERFSRDDEGKGVITKYKNYGTWLGTQSSTFQDEVLGKSRGAMFRSGRVTFDRMFTKNGDFVTVEQLEKRY